MHIIEPDARCAVIGYGSWATAIAKILLENEPRIGWFIKRPDVIEHIRRNGTNPRYLRDAHFCPDKIDMSDDINEVVAAADIIVLAVPSAFLKATLEPLTASLEGKFIISAIKGIIPDDYVTVGEYMNKRYGVPFDNFGVIAGPCHSEEVALERLSYLTMVSKRMENAQTLCKKFSTHYIHANPSTDIYGTEYAAVLKNIYAICAGIAVGLGYGDNFLSVLICNAAVEMNRFLSLSYPSPRETSASAYLGDLLVTSYSQFSRNRTFGTMLGKGYSITSAAAETNMVVEGYYGAACIRQVNKRFGIEMPLADGVYRILYENGRPAHEMGKIAETLI